jgi:putative ATPase
MTTANPYHSINPAIRSRCQLFELKELEDTDIEDAIKKLVKTNILPDIKIDTDARKYIVNVSGHDLRYAYNLIEVAYYSSNDYHITVDMLTSICNKPNIFLDKNGDGYYDMLSAFQKSIRGSDVQASLYYLARLIESDELDSICRRMAVIVYEDIGLANPALGPRVMAAIDSAYMLGFPEARIPLAEVVIEMALSPKSNSAVMAIDSALDAVTKINNEDIPSYLKSPYIGYKYPHNFKNDYVKQQYLPNNIKDIKFYKPKENKNESIYKDIMDKLEKSN